MLNSLPLAAACVTLLCATPVRLWAAALIVTNTADRGPGTLRDALASAADADTISLSVTGMITLTSGELTVSKSLALLGPGPGALTVSGNRASRVFKVTGTNVTITGLTIANGSAENGGGIWNSAVGTLTISNCTVSGNRASFSGGGLYNSSYSTLALITSTFSSNGAENGGGIYNDGEIWGATLTTISASTFSGNTAGNIGGGVFNDGWLRISASTFRGNHGDPGGAILNFGGLEIGNTILDQAGAGGGTIEGHCDSAGYNLSSDNGGGFLTATGDQTNTDPKLGPLQDNGGPTWTHALLPGSPALDQGKAITVPGLACNTDQRGLARWSDFLTVANATGGDGSDIGAFEVQADVPLDADGDGLPDSWEREWFNGLSQSGTGDFDGDGRNNLFEYVTGTNPADQTSAFELRAEPVAGHPDWMRLVFKPWTAGRTYNPQFTTNLADPAFAPLTGYGGPTTNGTEVTITDLNATEGRKFYRLQIALP